MKFIEINLCFFKNCLNFVLKLKLIRFKSLHSHCYANGIGENAQTARDCTANWWNRHDIQLDHNQPVDPDRPASLDSGTQIGRGSACPYHGDGQRPRSICEVGWSRSAGRFAKLGAKLALVDINTEQNEQTAKNIKEMGFDHVFSFTCDVSNRDDVYRMADNVRKTVGNVDILVNNAGIASKKCILDIPDTMIQKTMDINANALFWMLKAFLPYMLEKNHGHVVCTASGVGFFGLVKLCDYAASKGAVILTIQSLHQELHYLGKNGVKTTLICPTFIDTGLFGSPKAGSCEITMPLLSIAYTADRAMDGILTDRSFVMIPRGLYLLYILQAILPTASMVYLADKLGLVDSIDNFDDVRKEN